DLNRAASPAAREPNRSSRPARIVDISKAAYVLATPRRVQSRRVRATDEQRPVDSPAPCPPVCSAATRPVQNRGSSLGPPALHPGQPRTSALRRPRTVASPYLGASCFWDDALCGP